MANETLVINKNDARMTVIGKSWPDEATDSGGGEWYPVPTTGLPVRIAVTTPPTKTEYNDGEWIDFSGMVVTAYDENGDVWTSEDYQNGTIPFDEILPSIRKAVLKLSESIKYGELADGTPLPFLSGKDITVRQTFTRPNGSYYSDLEYEFIFTIPNDSIAFALSYDDSSSQYPRFYIHIYSHLRFAGYNTYTTDGTNYVGDYNYDNQVILKNKYRRIEHHGSRTEEYSGEITQRYPFYSCGTSKNPDSLEDVPVAAQEFVGQSPAPSEQYLYRWIMWGVRGASYSYYYSFPYYSYDPSRDYDLNIETNIPIIFYEDLPKQYFEEDLAGYDNMLRKWEYLKRPWYMEPTHEFIARMILAGEIMGGSGIKLYWQRPVDGQILETSLEITVSGEEQS